MRNLSGKIKPFQWPVVILIGLWAVHLINTILNYQLNMFGIYPRTSQGLWGIAFSPWLHSNIQHIFLNSIPFLFLSLLVCFNGIKHYIKSSLFIIVLSGLLVWLFGRTALHIGASGLIFGYFGLLVSSAIKHRSFKSILLAVIAVSLYGGMFLALWPKDQSISWEAHLFGFISGILYAQIQKN